LAKIIKPPNSGTVTVTFDTPNDDETTCLFGPVRKKLRIEMRQIQHLLERSDEELEKLLNRTISAALLRPPPVLEKSIVEEYSNYYIYGRYRKLSRELANSNWVIGGCKKTESSVEEEIIKCFRVHFDFEKSQFHCAGREDVDVRMLGSGRPFVVEILKPNKDIQSWGPDEWKIVQETLPIGQSPVEISELQLKDEHIMKELHISAESHQKIYSALVRTEIPNPNLESIHLKKNMAVAQKTPMRVLHRRPNLIRQKEAILMEAIPLKPHFFELKVHTSAGMYVKEFVHGDLGRTKPSITSLLECECDILQLDVLDVIDP